jgi:hypothetical protein
MSARSRLIAGSLLPLLCAAAPLRAQSVERKGVIFGGSVGGGWISCDGCDTLGGLSAGFFGGWMLGERVALVVDGVSVMHPETGRSRLAQSTIAGIGARLFFKRRFWAQAVIGSGRQDSLRSLVDVDGESGSGAMGGVGFEIRQGRRFVIDVSARMGGYGLPSGDVKNLSVQLGLNLY